MSEQDHSVQPAPEGPPVTPPGRIVEAVGIAATAGLPGLGKVIEAFMGAAIEIAHAGHVTESDRVRALMMMGREAAKKVYPGLVQLLQDAMAEQQAEIDRQAAPRADAPELQRG